MSISNFSLFFILSVLSASTIFDQLNFADRMKPTWLRYLDRKNLSAEDQLTSTTKVIRNEFGIQLPGSTLAEALKSMVKFPNIPGFKTSKSFKDLLSRALKAVSSFSEDERLKKIKELFLFDRKVLAYKARIEGLSATTALGIIAEYEISLRELLKRSDQNEINNQFQDLNELRSFFDEYCDNFRVYFKIIGNFLSIQPRLNLLFQAQIRSMIFSIHIDDREFKFDPSLEKYNFDSFLEKIYQIVPAFCLANENATEKLSILTEDDRRFVPEAGKPLEILMNFLFENPPCGK